MVSFSRLSFRLSLIGVGLSLAFLTGGHQPLLASAAPAGSPFGTVHVAANRSSFTGTCPVAITFTATVDFQMPQPKGFVFNYTWKRSDGATSPQAVVRPPSNKNAWVLHQIWRVGGKGEKFTVSDTLNVASGNARASGTSPQVQITCR